MINYNGVIMKALLKLSLLVIASLVYAENVEISMRETLSENNIVQLNWRAEPGKTYSIQTTPTLWPSPWTNGTSLDLTTSNVIGSYETSITNHSQFFRVIKKDADPPAVRSLIPQENAITVLSNATVCIGLQDETGVDTNSINLTIGSWTNITLADSNLSCADSTLAFNPPDGILGAPGTVLTNFLTVSDTLGNTLSNYTWKFRLSQTTIATNSFLPLITPSTRQESLSLPNTGQRQSQSLSEVQPPDDADKYHIISVMPNSVLFSYTDTAPSITNGSALVSFDSENPFYRSVTSSVVDHDQKTITAWTTNIPLTELVQQCSISSVNLSPAQNSATLSEAKESQNKLHVEFDNNLDDILLYEDADLKLNLSSGFWSFIGDVDTAFDIIDGKLHAMDTTVAGTLTLNMAPEALLHQACSGGGSTPLSLPTTYIFSGMAGPVPVWLEVAMELKADYDYSSNADGKLNTAIDTEKELIFNLRLRNNRWSSSMENPSLIIDTDTLTWELNGTANVKVCIHPTLTVVVHGLAGLRTDIETYSEIDGWYSQNPLEHNVAQYIGLLSKLGIDNEIWYESWGEKPEWVLFDRRWPFRPYIYPNELGFPKFVNQQKFMTVRQGDSITLPGYAIGKPFPDYQWYYDNKKIVGENHPAYFIVNAKPGHAGTYTVKASNSIGTTNTSFYLSVISDDGHVIGPSNPDPENLVWIPPGEFTMGSPEDETDRNDDEEPLTDVTITRGFFMGKYEVTQAEYEAVTGGNPSKWSDDPRLPVETVTWHEAIAYCEKLTEQERQAGRLPEGWEYRLPTEAEWEYACRAGTTTRFSYGDDPGYQKLSDFAWYKDNSGDRTHVVGQKLPNPWGLYDMHGNVWEWCMDWYADELPGGSVADPLGPDSGSYRVRRGGSWYKRPGDWRYRSANRGRCEPSRRSSRNGFRVVLAPSQP